MMREPGEIIVLEGMIGPRTGLAIPATIVKDTPDILACFVPDGVSTLRLIPAPEMTLPRVLSHQQIEASDLRLVPHVWSGRNVLYLAPQRDRYAIHARWLADWTFRGWYVNLQRPTTILPDRWVTEDQFLDIVVQPDRSWAWKDEDELGEAVRIGRLSEQEAVRIRAAGEAIVPRIERAEWPFSPDVPLWRPDPAWELPVIPPGWKPTRR
ncbi:MAG: DUF402 domain-containing protein [Thermomicrobiales bacterium]